MKPTSDPDSVRAELALSCKSRPMTLIRGPDEDPRLIYIRHDLAAWSDESAARHLIDLTDEELSWAQRGLELPDPANPDFLDEARHWRHIHGFFGWLDGGAHPLDLLDRRATGYRRANADPDLSHQRVSIGGQTAVVTEERLALLSSHPELAAQAASDPVRAMRAWSSELELAWREAEFDEPILFCQDALPPIAALTRLMVRRRRDGSWLFEHPLAPSWLCVMGSEGRRALREEFPHNGRAAVEIGAEGRDDPGEDWLG